jgi:ribosomal protein S18 acetylase RimI-like enzyme
LLNIRRAEVEDAAGIAQVNTLSWREAYAGLVSEEFLARWQVSPELWEQRLGGGGSRVSVFVATDERRIVGFTASGPTIDLGDLDPVAETVGRLYSLYVLAAYYDRGLGYRMHEAQLEALGQSGFTSARLWVLKGNKRAISFYVRQGWVDDRTVRQEDLDGEVLTEHRYSRANLATAPALPDLSGPDA